MNPADFPDDSPDQKPMETVEEAFDAFLWAAEELKKRDLSLGLQNRNKENLEERKSIDSYAESSAEARKLFWAIKEARRQRKRDYEAAKAFAFDMHSGFNNPKIVQKQENKEEQVSGEGKSRFQKVKEMIKERREEISTSLSTGMDLDLKMMTQRKAPTLMELSARALAKNSESIKSLNLVPDRLRKQLSNYVNDLGKINTLFMQLLIKDSPYEVYVKNCVDLEEQDLIQIICDCDRVSLTVIILLHLFYAENFQIFTC